MKKQLRRVGVRVAEELFHGNFESVDLLKQLSRLHAQGVSNRHDVEQTYIAFSALDPTDVGAM